MTPLQETLELLKANGFVRKRNSKHAIFYNPKTKVTVPVKRHGFDEEDMDYILKQAGIKNPRKSRKGK